MGADGGDDLLELSFKDEHPGTAVFDDKFQLWPCQPPVEGYENGSYFGKGKENFYILMAVIEKDGDLIPFFDTALQKKMTELIGTEVYLLVGKGVILKC